MPRDHRAKPELLRQLQLLSPVDRRVLAQLWGARSPEPEMLIATMLEPAAVNAVWERLGAPERAALTRVLADAGGTPVAVVQREYGGVREPRGFEHPRAYLDALQGPATPTERLFNFGLIFRAHDERGAIYRVPSDLVPLLPEAPPRDQTLRPAPIPQAAVATDAADPVDNLERLALTLLQLGYAGQLVALDDGALNKKSLVTLGKRLDPTDEMQGLRREAQWPFVAVVRTMLLEAGLLRRGSDGELRPAAAAVEWLRASRAERCRRLLHGWITSRIDELSLLCGLRWRGSAPYTLNHSAVRRNLLQLLATLPVSDWVALEDVVAEIHRVEPDFQRRDGRYDSWLLYAGDRLVSAWEDWPEVEGRLIGAVITGPLCWLGLFEVGADRTDLPIRLTPLGAHLLADAPAPPEAAPEPLIVQSTFEVICPPGAALYARFGIGRIAELQQSGTVAIYRLTRPALLAAIERGIGAADALRFLEEQSGGAVPANVAYSLREWGGQADQVRIADAVLVETDDPVVLARVRAVKGAGLDALEPLTPTLLRVPAGDADGLAERLRRAGFGLSDQRSDLRAPLDERDLRTLLVAALAYAGACAELGLPCEVSAAALGRLTRRLPTRWVDSAQGAAGGFIRQLQAQLQPPDTPE